MNRILFAGLLFCLLLPAGCKQAELEKARTEVAAAAAKVQEANDKLARANAALSARTEAARGKRLVHIVWFQMSDDADRDAFVSELQKLDDIEVVLDLEIGRFQDLGDERAMSDLDIVMQMGFQSEDDYRTYQDHPIHIQLKKDIGSFISAPPATYDYWSE